jgi:hypothetical protein
MLVRISLLVATLISFSACGGGGGGGTAPVPSSQFCGNDTQYALANPQNGGFVNSGTPAVEIVANGNNNTIANSFQNFDLIFVPQFGNNQVFTGSLSPTADPNGPHPFASDFYYSATVQPPGLFAGQQYSVFLNANANCNPIPLGTLFT